MQPARPSQSSTAISVVWALAPLFTCGFATPFTMGYAAYRKRDPVIAVVASLYLLGLFVMFVLIAAYDGAQEYPGWAALLIVAGLFTNWIGGLIHSLVIRSTVFAPRGAGAAPYFPPPRDHRPPSGPYPQHPARAPYPPRNQPPGQRRPDNPYQPGSAPHRHPAQDPRQQQPQGRPQYQQQRPQPQPQHHSQPQAQPQSRPQPQPQAQHHSQGQGLAQPQPQAQPHGLPRYQEQGLRQQHPQDQRPATLRMPAPPVTTNPPAHARTAALDTGASTAPGTPSASATPGSGGPRGASTLPTQSPGPLPAGEPDHIGPYRLIGSLGQGGQGAVYLGETPDGTRVAIKVLHARLAAESGAHQRFLREVEAARRVAPFSTARVIDADVADDRLFIVSEYVEGASLEQLVRERGPRGHDGLVRLALGTSGALAAIHRAGIVHRDFKPSNILIGSDGPRVVDFGIARVLDNATATSSGVLGTPAYMSPEQVSGERVGPESDIFSWAATMVFAATGRPAFGEDNIAAVFNRIFTKQPDLSALPDSLAQVVGTCLDKRPENRPTASDVMLAIVH
ncbi:serine/threonine-protein kinase [Sphaerisporangium dianthi]|uniref:non-specific serine/threonine protein kinase n=1 Tax=Sphaerisporangium dianthi TaxID=1436120 RepID=A0ABV9CAY2_9ACTN